MSERLTPRKCSCAVRRESGAVVGRGEVRSGRSCSRLAAQEGRVGGGWRRVKAGRGKHAARLRCGCPGSLPPLPLLPELPEDALGRSVDVRGVERRQPGLHVLVGGVDEVGGVDPPVAARELPAAVEEGGEGGGCGGFGGEGVGRRREEAKHVLRSL